MRIQSILLLACLFLIGTLLPFYSQAAEETLLLRNNLQRAQPGDYIVTAQNKNYTILLVRSKDTDNISIDEITVPSQRVQQPISWKNWIEKSAPGNTCWIMYTIHLPTGAIQKTFSFTKNEWVTIPQSQNFLSTLLNLQFEKVPDSERKKMGSAMSVKTDQRALWQPPLIVQGKKISGVTFEEWRTHWPKDGTELSERTIEVYLPKDSDKYPSYFPYWLQISGMVGKAKVRIIDSGSQAFIQRKGQ